jgi:uncharacterized membrane protein
VPESRDRFFLSLVLTAILTLSSLTAYQAIERAHHCGYAGDDAIYVQTLWNTAHGRLWRYSLESWDGPIDESERVHLSSHADFTHLVYVPFLWLVPRVETVLVLQPLFVALGALPLFALARRTLRSSGLAAAIAGLYLVYPPLVGNSLRPVGVLLSAPLLLLALERLQADKLRAAALAFAGAILTREDVALPVAVFLAIVAARERPRRAFALSIGAAGIAWLLLYTAVKSSLFGPGPDHLKRFSALGGSLAEIALSPLLHPVAFVGTLAAPESWRLYALLLLPLAFVPLLSPRHAAAAAAPVALVALSSVETDRILGRYLIAAAPFLFAGLIAAIERLGRARKGELLRLLAILLVSTLIFSTWWTNLWPFGRYENLRVLNLLLPKILRRYTPESEAVLERVAAIPEGATVSASATMLIPLAHRRRLFPFPVRAREVDWVLIDTRFHQWPPSTQDEHRRSIAELESEPGARVERIGSFLLIERKKG